MKTIETWLNALFVMLFAYLAIWGIAGLATVNKAAEFLWTLLAFAFISLPLILIGYLIWLLLGGG